jgi:ribosome biogenesis GTPase
MRGAEGRHTTTASRLHQVNATTALMDTPGVRDFAPALAPLDPGSLGFREIARLAPQCRFADCRHLQEPDCAVRAALAASAPARRRYESYRRLRRLHNDRMAATKAQGRKSR